MGRLELSRLSEMVEAMAMKILGARRGEVITLRRTLHCGHRTFMGCSRWVFEPPSLRL
jgi:hypothetical protein